jgi:hypothetical protein
LAVAQRLKGRIANAIAILEHDGEGTAPLESWKDADVVLLFDAVSSGAEPGSSRRLSLEARSATAIMAGVKIKLGALSHRCLERARGHFEVASRGTLGERAGLKIKVLPDSNGPRAQDVLLDSIEVEE